MSDLGLQSWKQLSDVAVKGAEYNSHERQPHPKCLPGTRVNFLRHINELLDDGQGSRIIWVHGMAGIGKSAVAFTIADRMRGLKATETPNEKRLGGTFFFTRGYTNRCTTGYFFATLACQLASNFPSIQSEVNEAIRKKPSILDPNKPLPEQMEALFLEPLRRLRLRLHERPPLVFVADALDECTSEAEIVDLISLLGEALRDPGLPVIHILLTRRSEAHIREAMRKEGTRSLVHEIPVKTSGEGATSISLDGADVDNDICIFLKHSFTTLQSRYPDFPQPTQYNLEKLASRAGRRFIVASTMMKFIDDEYNDPRDRLQLMLDLTNELLPGTEVFLFYDRILKTCADPLRVYLHLSVVAALANPLPISRISELLGPGEGKDVEKALLQLRSVMNIPTDRSLPIAVNHASVRDYFLNPSHCSLLKGRCITSTHYLLARASFRLMIDKIPKSTRILDALSELNKHSQAIESRDPQSLKDSLAFIEKSPIPLTSLGVLTALVWLRGDRSPQLRSWLDTEEGYAWLHTQDGRDWLGAVDISWVQTQDGGCWLGRTSGSLWLMSPRGRSWLNSQSGWNWLWTLPSGRDWLLSNPVYAVDFKSLTACLASVYGHGITS